MDELTTLRSRPIPRPDLLARRLGRRFAPVWGFVAYGALYLFPAAIIGMAALVGVLAAPGDRLGVPRPAWLLAIAYVVALGAFAASWWPFARWVARRRGQAYRLFSLGRIVDANVVSVHLFTMRGVPVTRAKVRYQDEQRSREAVLSLAGLPGVLAPGAVLPLLIADGCRHSAAFVNGRAVAAS